MKQKLSEVMDVVDIFKRLTLKHFNNLSVSYKIAKAYKDLENQRDFYVTEERKLVEEYAMKDDKGQVIVENNNQIHFKTVDDAKAFNEGIANLCNMEVDVFEPFEIQVSDFRKNEMDLTPLDLIKLENFIIFKEQEADC